MKKAKAIITIIAASVFLFSFRNDMRIGSKKIGGQTWATANLDVSNFKNGDAIPEVKADSEWIKAGEDGRPAWCYYNNDAASGKKYGKLYNYFAVNDPRGLAPAGWHVPNDLEWITLTAHLGGEAVAGKKMKATGGWQEGGNGNNASGFVGLPGGRREFYGAFNNAGSRGYWWSSTEGKASIALGDGLTSNKGYVNGFDYEGRVAFSVRCVKD
ncbi:MAG: fibrobacter succinogenes major paralogous domain-containing protein [Chitinophagaceae bacterium]